jgi:hypothetical protein
MALLIPILGAVGEHGWEFLTFVKWFNYFQEGQNKQKWLKNLQKLLPNLGQGSPFRSVPIEQFR